MAVDKFKVTLVEPKRERVVSPVILVLLGLVGGAFILAAFVPQISSHPRPGQRAATITEIAALKNGITTFQADNGRVPRADEGLDALVHAPAALAKTWRGPYIEYVGPDAWGHAFHYVFPASVKYGFNIVSVGADGVEGTDDDMDVHMSE